MANIIVRGRVFLQTKAETTASETNSLQIKIDNLLVKVYRFTIYNFASLYTSL
jgi:hypothetical protein